VTTRYLWGDSPKKACKYANVFPCGEEVKREIGRLPPNRFGLYDVIGNVWEWTQDCWNDSYNGAPADGSAWLTGDCRNRVMRGGSFDELPLNYRLSMRGRGAVMPRGDFQGLRLARSVALAN
jgi:formylglycine-generating enzyme required for sulfatase activity